MRDQGKGTQHQSRPRPAAQTRRGPLSGSTATGEQRHPAPDIGLKAGPLRTPIGSTVVQRHAQPEFRGTNNTLQQRVAAPRPHFLPSTSKAPSSSPREATRAKAVDKSSERRLSLKRSWQQGHSTHHSTAFEPSRLQGIHPDERVELSCAGPDGRVWRPAGTPPGTLLGRQRAGLSAVG